MPTNAPALREGLPPLPEGLQHLPLDARGYPVPRFVAMVDGKPDHRIADVAYMAQAVQRGLCWICGRAMPADGSMAFLVGPAALVTRISPEPPMHAECAGYAARACPFLTRPYARRRDAGRPAEAVRPPGNMLPDHPVCACVWHCRSFAVEAHPVAGGGVGLLFDLGEPFAMQWLCEGREAMPEELLASVRHSLGTMQRVAQAESPEAEAAFHRAASDALDMVARFDVPSPLRH